MFWEIGAENVYVVQALNVLPLERAALVGNVKVNTGSRHAVCGSEGAECRK